MTRMVASAWLLDDAVRYPYRLYVGDTTIGRTSDNDIVLSDEYVSRYEALIRYQHNAFMLILREAANPILLNGYVVRQPQQLYHRDVITMGQSRFYFLTEAL